MAYPRTEWQRVHLPDIDTFPTLSLDRSEEFAWGKRDVFYDVEVTRLALEGGGVYGVRIIKENGALIDPKSPTWWRIFRSYLEWKASQSEEYEAELEAFDEETAGEESDD